MASRLFGNSHINVKYFEIRLDQSTLILRGNEDEASSAILKGTLVLCLSEALKAQSIRLRFTGEKRVGWGAGSNSAKKDEEFVRQTWEFLNTGPKRGDTLAAGNYEWPFEYLLPGYTPESIEGLQDSWIIYRLKATIERGILAQNVFARKHVRIVRTPDTAALELSHEMSVENTWADKIDYTLSTPTKAVIFGTAIQVNFRIAPLLKGLRIGEVTTKIHETQDMIIDMRKHAKKSKVSRDIAEDKFDVPQDQETALVDGQDSWLHATLPLYIYISPNLLLDEDNCMITRHIGAVDPEAFAIGAPPVYGEHRLDILYSDLDPAGYMTPAGGLSGIGTPFDSQSRRGSADNLTSINAMASTGVPPIALQSRLGNLGDRLGFNGSSSHIPAMSSSVDDRGILPDRSDSLIQGENQQSSNEIDLSRRTSDHDSEHSAKFLLRISLSLVGRLPDRKDNTRTHQKQPAQWWRPSDRLDL
ncbi:MAG: hypothetical protein LQ346_005656 [Caloplaca aetnensis]|nr:MAG: hypothetical protein LQ346_005656 [Caloplaca aetnensis]